MMKMNNTFHISLLLIAVFCLATVIFKDLRQTRNAIKKIKNQKRQFEKRYEDLLRETADSRQIFNYFLETKNKLNDDLHNIMLGLALGDDFYAKLYINELKVDYSQIEKRMEKKGCRCSEKRRMIK
jgi:hypothetical protein